MRCSNLHLSILKPNIVIGVNKITQITIIQLTKFDCAKSNPFLPK
jgi:hypothetical protein